MSFDADFIVDRRRMRRKLTFWRVVTVLVVIVAVVGAGLAFSNRGAITGPGGGIARVNIEGLIRGSRERS
jgi:protease-4